LRFHIEHRAAMSQVIRRTAAHCLHCLAWALALALTSATVAAQPTSAERCRQQYPTNPAAQLQCVRNAFTALAAKAQSSPALYSPLANVQVIFGFFDRRFPGYNNGQEHLGVDYAAAAGTAVTAICDGTVVSNNSSHADIVSAVVVIEHECAQPLGTVYGYYGHVQSDLLPGESVSAGSSVGAVRDWAGNTHLHLGLNTRLLEENWGVVPRGATLSELEAQGWLNPSNFFSATQPMRATRGVAQPVTRSVRPTAGGKPATGTVRRKP
jgi:Peptidase family M23